MTEASRLWPKRKTHLDGTIGDADHQARQSDHNPDARGIVHAFDLTHDPDNGVHCGLLAELLRVRKDSRVRKIIWDHQTVESSNWEWRDYDGKSPHTGHMHVSIHTTKQAEDDTSDWWASTWAEQLLARGLLLARVAGKQPEVKKQSSPKAKDAAAAEVLGAPIHMVQYTLGHVVGHFGMTVQGPAREPATGVLPPPPPGFQRFLGKPTKEMVDECNRLKPLVKSVKNPGGLTVGSYYIKALGGRLCAFLLEWHKHPEKDNVTEALKNWHRGWSTFVLKP